MLANIKSSRSLYPAKQVTRPAKVISSSGSASFTVGLSNFNFVYSESSVGSRKPKKHLFSACKIPREHAIDCITQQYSFKANLSLDIHIKHSGLKVTSNNLVNFESNYFVTILKSNSLQLLVTKKVICYCNFVTCNIKLLPNTANTRKMVSYRKQIACQHSWSTSKIPHT